jgi:hypothetical protein
MPAPDLDPAIPDRPARSVTRLAGLTLVVGLFAGAGGWLSGEAILCAYRADLDLRIGREVDAGAARRGAGAQLDSASGKFAAFSGGP